VDPPCQRGIANRGGHHIPSAGATALHWTAEHLPSRAGFRRARCAGVDCCRERTAASEGGFWASLGAGFDKIVLPLRIFVASVVVLIVASVAFVVLWIFGFSAAWALGWVLGGLAVIPLSAALALGWGFLPTAPGPYRIVSVALLAALIATFVRLSVEVANPQFEQVSVCARNPDGVFQGPGPVYRRDRQRCLSRRP
jgi:hypothetical protein